MRKKEIYHSADLEEVNSSCSFPLNTPESIGEFMAKHSPGDRTMLPMAFGFFGCISTGVSYIGAKVAELLEPEDETLSSICEKK